jgi:hypothetical protein
MFVQSKNLGIPIQIPLAPFAKGGMAPTWVVVILMSSAVSRFRPALGRWVASLSRGLGTFRNDRALYFTAFLPVHLLADYAA